MPMSSPPRTAQPLDVALATKLFAPPPRRDAVARPRLIQQLELGQDGPLTLVVAPAGSGKTTLLGAWYAARAATGMPVAWLTLDREDNDLARFLRYLVAALQVHYPDMGADLAGALGWPQLPPVEGLLTLLVNDLAAAADEITLVLDDYHVIEAPEIHQGLTFLLDHLPPQVHLVIASRADPPLPLPRLRARGQMIEVRAADLRFTPEEVADFLDRALDVRLAPDVVAALAARTEGWAAGLQLAALSLQRHPDPSEFVEVFAGSHRYIVDYLADEVLTHQPEDMQDFLLRTCLLDRLSGALCDAVTGRDDGQAVLEALERANLFLIPLDGERRWYRYHHLFADFLRARLRQAQPALIPQLHRAAAAWYERAGMQRDAVKHALAAPDYETAARLIERLAKPMQWQRSEVATLRGWMEQLPEEVILARPGLCIEDVWLGVWSGDAARVVSRLERAERSLVAHDTDPAHAESAAARALRGELAALRATITYFQGQAAETIALAQDAVACLSADQGAIRGIAYAELGLGQSWQGEIAAALRSHTEGARVSEATGQHALALADLGYVVHDQLLAGHLGEAAHTYERALELAGAWRLASSPMLGLARVYMGQVLWERNELERADGVLRQGIEQSGQVGAHFEHHLDGLLNLALLRQARGDPQGAAASLGLAEQQGCASPFASRVALTRAKLSWARGAVEALGTWAAEREDALRMDDAPRGEHIADYLMVARVRIARQQAGDALRLLERVQPLAKAGGYGRATLDAHVLQALARQALGERPGALEALGRALALAEPEGFVRVFVDEGAPMAALLREALDRGIRPGYAATLLAAFGENVSRAPGIPRRAQPLADPLSERELEVLRLVAAGLSNAEIAERLIITEGTVKNHVKSIYGKLEAHSRVQAAERARALNLL